MNPSLKFIQKNEPVKFLSHPEYTVSPQYHTCHEMVFYDMGCSGKTTIDGIEYNFKGGDIAVIPRNVIHSEEHYSGGTVYFFGFSTEENIKIPPAGIYFNMFHLKLLFATIYREIVNQEYEYKSIISLKIAEIIHLLNRSLIPPTKESKNLSHVKTYIEENYMYKINFETLAKSTGYSYDHFRHLFNTTFGLSPRTLLINVRCEKAIELLTTTNLSCTDIAYQCGFSDNAQFTKIIKEKYGVSPLKIKKDVKN